MGSIAKGDTRCSRMGDIVSAFRSGECHSARWTIGSMLLAPLAAANSSYCAAPAILLLGIFTTIASFTCKDLRKLSEILPPARTSRGRRDRNIRSFADFMAMWMTFLSHLVAVAICARILSATADHVTEGRTRRWLFGYETRALGEPWPDALGVTVVLVVCGLFMCGLEESSTFTLILMVLLYIFNQFFVIFGLINLDIEHISMPIPLTVYELIAAAAPVSYAFGIVTPSSKDRNSSKHILLMVGLLTTVLCGLCFLYTNLLKGSPIDPALPVTTLVESRSTTWICPLLAIVTVAGVSLALTELCPLLFSVLVTLASPEWKVLTRSMTYESAATGSPVLAVFTAGSLAAILAFACPLSHMITLMNASHLIGIAIQGFHYTIMRCVPTAEQKEAGDIEYSRLGKPSTSKIKIIAEKTKRRLWFIPSALRQTKTIESLKSKAGKGADERECLLLDDYSGCPSEEIEHLAGGSTLASEIQPIITDVPSDEVSEPEISSGDESTDIDAVVKEYRDTVQVVTSTPEASAPIPPCVRGARLSTVGGILQVISDALIAIAFCNEKIRTPSFATGIPLWILGTLLCARQPAHKFDMRRGQCIEGPITMLIALLLLTPLLLDSWPAIILFSGAGIVIYARCERWCGDLALKQAQHVVDRRRLHPVVPITSGVARLAHVDAVYITR